MFRHEGTSERDVGAPLMPLNAFARHRPSHKAYHEQKRNPWLAMASVSRHAPDECAVPPLDIGVQAMQLSPYRTGVAGLYHPCLPIHPALRTCACPLALSGLGQSFASKSSALNFGPLQGQFTPYVTWRTLSPHPALQFPVFPSPGSTPWHGRMFRIVSALRISRTFAPFPEGNLLSFADGLL